MLYKQRLLKILLIGYGGLMLLLIGMLTVSMFLNSDVLYMDTTIVQVLEIAVTFVDILAYAISAIVIIYGIYLYGAKHLTTIYSCYLCITVFHYVAILCIGWMVFPDTLPKSVQELFLSLLENIILFVLFDCLRIFIIALITATLLNKSEKYRLEKNSKSSVLGQEISDARSIAFPFSSFVSFSNPIQIGIFATAVIYWLTYLIQYIYIDILTLIEVEYVEGLGMQLVYLLLNAVLSCVCYCIMMYFVIKLDEKMPKTEE